MQMAVAHSMQKMARPIIIILVWYPLAAISLSTAWAQDSSETARKVFSSLALVINLDSRGGMGAASAFCIYSTKNRSYFLTNRHVVEGSSQLLLRPPVSGVGNFNLTTALDFNPLVKARVYPRPEVPREPDAFGSVDLAVLVIDIGNIPAVIFRDGAAGAAIGIAGYPSFRFSGARSLGEVEPSVHFGTVNAFSGRFYYARRFLEFDAVTDHGNSGGPLFALNSGNVYGVVTLGIPSLTSSRVQNNLAISSEVAQEFLAYSYVPYYYYSHSSSGAMVSTIPCRARWPEGYPYAEFKALQRKFCALPDAIN